MSDAELKISRTKICETTSDKNIVCHCGRTISENYSLLIFERDKRALTKDEYEEYKQNGWNTNVRHLRCPSCIKCSICQKELNSLEFYQMEHSGHHPDIKGKFIIFHTHISCYEDVMLESNKAKEEYGKITRARLNSLSLSNNFEILNEAVKIREILVKNKSCIKCGEYLGLKERFQKSLVCLPRKKFLSTQELPNMCYVHSNPYLQCDLSKYHDSKKSKITRDNLIDFLKDENTIEVKKYIAYVYDDLVSDRLVIP